MHADRGLYQTYHEPSLQAHSKRRILHGRTYKTNARHRNTNSTRNAESHIVPKVDGSSIRSDGKSNTVTRTPTTHDEPTTTEIQHDEATKTEVPPSPQLDDQSVIKKAKATIASKMTDPDSVEFEGMERAARKNMLGKATDTICGFVSDKNSGPKPFLYLVQKDEVYIGGYTIATSEYRNICSITTLPGH
jgi:hypothetical protein